MKRYIGTKTLTARPMTRGEYNAYRGWETPANEDPSEAGYLVEYEDGGKPNDPRHAGYISWSPADVFERTYRSIDTHQDRVRAEVKDRTGELSRLTAFINGNPAFAQLPLAEQMRMKHQRTLMVGLVAVLNDRIAAFDAPPETPEQHTENPDHTEA
jgi:hypothetical protein